MMKKTALATALLLTIAACGTSADEPEGEETTTPDSETTHVVTDEEYERATDASLESSIDVLRAQDADNGLISPASLSYALAMAGEGAQCETLTEINEFLGVEDGSRSTIYPGLLRPANKSGEEYVTGFSAAVAHNTGVPDTRLDVLENVAESYDAHLFSDSLTNLQPALDSWVEESTGGLQTQLPVPLPENTATGFITAMHYETEWQGDATKTTFEFTSSDGQVEDVRGVYLPGNVTAREADRGTILELPTDSPDTTYVFYPDEVIDPADLTADDWDLEDAGEPTDVHLRIPAVDFDSQTDVLKYKDDIGLPNIDAKEEGCGLAGFSKSEQHSVEIVVQKATFKLDDEGIAASAVTEIIGEAGAAPGQEEPVIINVDRPYAVLTVSEDTDWALMYATITDPGAITPAMY